VAKIRKDGEIHPGIKWGRFTIRIPFYHVKLTLPESLQGGLITLATAAAAAPLFMRFFGLPFEIAWALSALPLIWYYVQPLLFGDPFAPGWITPSIPLVLVFLGGYGAGVQAIQAMTALAIIVAGIFLLFAVTDMGKRFFSWVPIELRSAIILASAIAAFNGELTRHATLPYTLTAVWIVVFLLMFSIWFSAKKATNKLFYYMASMSMLIGFVVAGIVGPLSGEFSFDIKMGIFIPPFVDAIKAVHPFSIGFPTWDMFVAALPLALMVYVIAFGDLIVANTLLDEADKVRTDEKLVIDTTRTHYTLFFRNIGQVLTFGPLIPMHGPIWTGVTVFLVERYKQGRNVMDSFYSGALSWYLPAFILVFITPIVNILQPMLPVALSITLILTGFACAYIAMRMVTTPTGQGYALFVALCIVRFGPAWGLGIGIALYFLLLANMTKSSAAT
jgi:hypothetical protein